MKSTTAIEIDVERCSLTYGESPCAAVLGITGDEKCINTRGTCQDIANFDPESQTLRFSKQPETGSIPSILSYDYRAGIINPGVDMGTRSSLTVTLRDHPHSDVEFDRYIDDRGGQHWIGLDNPMRETSEDILFLRFVNGTYFAGGTGGSLMQSQDGSDWSDISASEFGSNTITDIDFGLGLYVVVGNNGSTGGVWTTPDLTTWTSRTHGLSGYPIGVAFYPGMDNLIDLQEAGTLAAFVVIGSETEATFSDDGTTWELFTDTGSLTGEFVHILQFVDTPAFGLAFTDDDERVGFAVNNGQPIMSGGAALLNGVVRSSWTRVLADDQRGANGYLATNDSGIYTFSSSGSLATISGFTFDKDLTAAYSQVISLPFFQPADRVYFGASDGGLYSRMVPGSATWTDHAQDLLPGPLHGVLVDSQGRIVVMGEFGSGNNMAVLSGNLGEYDPTQSGTYWGKFRARFPYAMGYPLRLESGIDDDSKTHHFIIEGMSGPANSQYTITAKDILKLAQGKRAQCPRMSNGEVGNSGGINAGAGSMTLSPAGIGNAEYPASGAATIGDEVVIFTRSGDTMTLTTRGAFGTTAVDHDEGELVQLCHQWVSQSISTIIRDLLVDFADVPSSLIPFSEWEDEVDTYIDRLYTAIIAKPEDVEKLINELIMQAGLVFWFDDVTQKINLRALKPVVPGLRSVTSSEIMEGTFSQREQPDKRVSQVWTRYNVINVLEDDDDEKNFAAGVVTVDGDAETAYGSSRIKKIFSRWFGLGSRPAAQRVNDLQLSRYVDPPRSFSFDLYRSSEPLSPGETFVINHREVQDALGRNAIIPAIVTSFKITEDRYKVTAEEFTYKQRDTDEAEFGRQIPIDSNVIVDTRAGDGRAINLRTLHDYDHPAPDATTIVTFIIDPNVMVGATNASRRAVTVGSWPAGCTVNVIIRPGGSIRGAGGLRGQGGVEGSSNGGNGQNGGVALYTRFPINLTNQGTIAGGGGGGGGGGLGAQTIDIGEGIPQTFFETGGNGGHGAGYVSGHGDITNGQAGQPKSTGGSGGNGGAAGQPGTAGSAGTFLSDFDPPTSPGGNGGTGGAAGAAIDGHSFITYVEAGTIIGAQIN